MKTEIMNIEQRDVFEQIGNLFYAIAADQHVTPLEVAELKSLISKDWQPRDREAFRVSDEAHYLLVTIDALERSKATASETFKAFTEFYASHQEVFSKEITQRILETAEEITKIFKAGKPDNPHLQTLKELLN